MVDHCSVWAAISSWLPATFDEIVEALVELHEAQEEVKDKTEQIAATKAKKIDPGAFFKNLKDGGMKKRDTTKKDKSGKESKPGASQANIDDFKKKLTLQHLG